MEIDMRKIIIPYLLTAFFSASFLPGAFAQNKLKEINSWTSFQAIPGFSGDTLLIRSDTIFIINKTSFKNYAATFDKLKDKNLLAKELVANYENLIQVQENMLNTKEAYYQELKAKFDSLAGNATIFIDKSSTSISQISTSLGKASDNLVETQKLLMDSQKLLEEERKNNWKRTLKIGIGGFSVGVVVTALIFLIKK
jgi:purine-nucleoside phosphorylase